MDYCRVLTDEIFGRKNFMNRITVDSRSPSAFSTVNPGVFKAAEYILFYAKKRELLLENQLRVERAPDYAYDKYITNIDDDYKNWKYISVSEAYAQSNPKATTSPQTALNNYNKFIISNANSIFRFTAISDTGAGQAVVSLKYESKKNPNKIYCLERNNLDNVYVLNGQQLSFYSKNIANIDGKKCASKMLTDIWTDIAWEGIANEGAVRFKKGKKPEKLIKRCLELVTKPGDLVLDCFLGSGTTTAVAHKMRRKYIGIEFGDHCYSLCKPRLDKIIDGEKSGISRIVEWQGGGGYHFYELAPSLLVKNDKLPIYQINPEYTFEMLCEAICKIEGFHYKPTGLIHGYSSESRFIHVTKEFVNAEYIKFIASSLSDRQSLLIYATKVQSKLLLPDNIEVKRIPKDLLKKCTFESEVR